MIRARRLNLFTSSTKMEAKQHIPEEIFTTENSAALDDFLQELAAKERDLNISSGAVFEIEGNDLIDDSIPDFIKNELVADPIRPELNIERSIDSPPVYESPEVKQMREQIAQLEAENRDTKVYLQRQQKDFENFRRRTDRERGDTFHNQLAMIATQLLPVLDNMNRALDVATNMADGKKKDFQQFFNGILLVNQQLNETLAEMGVEPIISVGKPFDPELHEAVAAEQQPDVIPNTVTVELLRGYRIGDRIIRPAMVKVAA